MNLREEFRAHLASLTPPPRGRWLVAVSGGPDSVALLDLLAGSRAELELELVVGHVDHGIHPESGEVAEGVRRLAYRYGLRFVCRTLGLGPNATETAARAARYGALEDLRRETGADLVVTAHHADDQAETVLMRVLAGTGPAGLAAMPARRGRLLRPLLPFRREELARHVQEAGLWSWSDPANRDPRHLRSWLRSEILPLLEARVPDLAGRLLRVASQAGRDRAAWDAALEVLPGLDCRVEGGVVSLAAEPLNGYEDNLALRLVMAAAARVGCQLGPGRAARVLELARRGRSGGWVPLGSAWMAEVTFSRLRVARSGAAPPPPARRDLTGERGVAKWGEWRFTWSLALAPARQDRTGRTAWFAPADLAIRPWRAGERVKPLGGAGRRLVVRCLQEARVPRSVRSGWPALEHRGAIVWLPGVCRSDLLVPPAGAEALRVDAELA